MNRKKIVAIDDVGDILDLLEYNLNKEGMDVEVFTDSQRALESISTSPPDLVVCDWMMPEPNGIEMIRALRNSTSTADIPFIMLTCKADIQDYREALKAGANDFVVKPVRMEELIRRIKILLPDERQRVKFA